MLLKLKELNAAKEAIAKLKAYIAKELPSSLAKLPSAYGFSSFEDFASAVRKASGQRSPRKADKPVAQPAKQTNSTRRTRAKITPATRASVKRLVKAGRTGAAIAKELGISIPSVQNIKKALGLVRTSKAK